ncbi:hypothetical protein [Thalassoroseus pseudoceratinae]|uniref:hypothetical protein n=1 Tax=Thalassoroseus pseudoceratinae TaxID=2713176 RepID=UPI0014248E1A|nr:hypothetical protein [Thalassoroseus pseudoceratinae]
MSYADKEEFTSSDHVVSTMTAEPSSHQTGNTAADDSATDADELVLQDKMPEWFRTSWVFPAGVALLGVFFLYLSYQPLWHTDLWGHLSYGRVLAEEGLGALYGEEPLMPLAVGVDFIDTAWLSQYLTYLAYENLGISVLQFLYAVSITACVSILMTRFYRHTQNFVVSVLSVCAFLWVDWQQLLIIRPQLAGLACFIALFAVLTARQWKSAFWVTIPALIGLWANLHGSFIMGLVLIGSFAIGHGFDVLRRTRNLKAVVSSRQTQRLVLVTQLAAVAALINPYGLALYTEVLTFGSNPNLSDLIEWDALNLRMSQGQAAAAISFALIVLYRLSPRRVRSVEVILLAGLGVATLWYSRMILWWAPVAAYYLARHGAAVWNRLQNRSPVENTRNVASLWTVMGLALIWLCFAPTNFALRVLHGKEPSLQSQRRMLSPNTPIDATAHLQQMAADGRIPKGVIFNPYYWGDYLLWAGPEQLDVFVASHVQYIPRTVWGHYRTVSMMRNSFEQTLDRYGINLMIVDKLYSGRLIDHMKRDPQWRVEFESALAVIFTRTEPI